MAAGLTKRFINIEDFANLAAIGASKKGFLKDSSRVG